MTQPKQLVITEVSDQTIKEFIDQYYKVVVKPLDANEGVGVTTSLTTVTEARAAIDKIAELGYTNILLENHVETINEYSHYYLEGKSN